MLQLAYISTARQPVDAAYVDSILKASRLNNGRAGLTGLLVSGGRRFLQVLEGEPSALLQTYARITADPRHFAVVELIRRPIDRREFGDWAMAHQAGGRAGEGPNLRDEIDRLVAPLGDPNLRAQFTGFAALHARAA